MNLTWRYSLRTLVLASVVGIVFVPLKFVSAQPSSNAPAGFYTDGKLRLRHELADWFGPEAADTGYSFSSIKAQAGLGYDADQFAMYTQGQYTRLMALPHQAIGIGSVYATANEGDSDPQALFVRQGWFTVRDQKDASLSGQAGRFLYSSGLEATHPDKTVTWLKTKRVSQRLIGPFDFTNGRSFDGVRFDVGKSSDGRGTLFLSHPTQGGFEINGMEDIDRITLSALSWTAPLSATQEAQAFAYFYGDDRNVVKTDNRPLPIRSAETSNIQIGTLGGHWIAAYPGERVSFDSVIWAALQAGDWGDQQHRAGSLVLEAGAKAEQINGKPWLRAGYTFGSGDSDRDDSRHTTFFQMMPTARPYALTPFYNMQNVHDGYLQAIWSPLDRLTLKSELHHLRLAEGEDLLYSGSGAGEQRSRFGYNGADTGGAESIGNLIDVDLSYELGKNLIVNLYYGYLVGGGAIRAVSPGSNEDIHYGFGEVLVQW